MAKYTAPIPPWPVCDRSDKVRTLSRRLHCPSVATPEDSQPPAAPESPVRRPSLRVLQRRRPSALLDRQNSSLRGRFHRAHPRVLRRLDPQDHRTQSPRLRALQRACSRSRLIALPHTRFFPRRGGISPFRHRRMVRPPCLRPHPRGRRRTLPRSPPIRKRKRLPLGRSGRSSRRFRPVRTGKCRSPVHRPRRRPQRRHPRHLGPPH
jgi:hypothetical protein